MKKNSKQVSKRKKRRPQMPQLEFEAPSSKVPKVESTGSVEPAGSSPVPVTSVPHNSLPGIPVSSLVCGASLVKLSPEEELSNSMSQSAPMLDNKHTAFATISLPPAPPRAPHPPTMMVLEEHASSPSSSEMMCSQTVVSSTCEARVAPFVPCQGNATPSAMLNFQARDVERTQHLTVQEVAKPSVKAAAPSKETEGRTSVGVSTEIKKEGCNVEERCSSSCSSGVRSCHQPSIRPSLSLVGNSHLSHTQAVKKECLQKRISSLQCPSLKMESRDFESKSSQLLTFSSCHRTKPSLVQSVITPCAKVIPTSMRLDTTRKPFSEIRELEVDYYPKFFQRSDADAILKELKQELTPYLRRSEVKVMGRMHKIPRTQAAFGNEGLSYHFSGVTVPANLWIPILEKIRDCLVDHLNEGFNFVLVNRYKDGSDHIGEHRDDERDLVDAASIACVSFGQERDFVLKHKDFRGKNANKSKDIPERKSNLEVSLKHGSLLVMKHPTNRDWYHSIPVRKAATTPRISLTFRVMKQS